MVRKISNQHKSAKRATKSQLKVGVVDLGTNSVRFAIYDFSDPSFPSLYKKKLMLRPGQGVYDTGRMKNSTIRKLVQAFERFKRRLDREGITRVKAVATSAVREARNGGVLIRQVKKATGIQIEVISGTQEAHLICEGILHFDPPRAHRAVLIDIGGGSTEVSLIHDQKRKASLSLPLGALRLKQIYIPEGGTVPSRLAGVALLRRSVQSILKKKIRSWPNRAGHLAVGSSGTIRAVARLLDRQRHQHRYSRLWQDQVKAKPRLHFNRSELQALVEKMLPMNRAQLLRLPGMERRRLDIILTGSVLLLELTEFLGVDRVNTSNHALRDGILLTFQSRRRKKP